MQRMLVCLTSFNKAAWADEEHPSILFSVGFSSCSFTHRNPCMGTVVKFEGLPRAVPLISRSALTGGTTGRAQTHPPLSLYGVARPRSPGDHPVPDPVCENCQGLHQQDPGGRAHRGALQVLRPPEPTKWQPGVEIRV